MESKATIEKKILQADGTPQIVLHHSCDTLSLGSFIQAYCKNDHTVLIISGEPSLEQLQDAFNEILFEYSSSIKTEDSDYMLDLQKNIGLLQWHVTYVENAVLLLRYRHVPEVIQELISIGYDGNYDFDDTKNYHMQLDRITSLCKTKVMDLEDATDEYNRMQKTTNGKKQTVEEFERNISMIKKFMGFRFDKSIMTSEYASYLNLYITEMNYKAKKGVENEE